MREDNERMFEAACLIVFLTGFGLIAYAVL